MFVYNAEINLLFPVLEFKKEMDNERIGLPILVRGSGFTMMVEKEDLKNAESATLQEIRTVIERIYPEFSKERTEMHYDERGFGYSSTQRLPERRSDNECAQESGVFYCNGA